MKNCFTAIETISVQIQSYQLSLFPPSLPCTPRLVLACIRGFLFFFLPHFAVLQFELNLWENTPSLPFHPFHFSLWFFFYERELLLPQHVGQTEVTNLFVPSFRHFLAHFPNCCIFLRKIFSNMKKDKSVRIVKVEETVVLFCYLFIYFFYSKF